MTAIALPEDDSVWCNLTTSKNSHNTDDIVSAWLEEGEDCLLESLRDKFVTGNWDKAQGDEEVVGDFEDLETGEHFGPDGIVDDDDDNDDAQTHNMTDLELRDYNAKKKAGSKANFDQHYDTDLVLQFISMRDECCD